MRHKTSIAIFIVLSLFSILFGVRYLLTSHLMAYHENFIGETEFQLRTLNPNIVFLLLTFMRIVGSLMIAIGITSLVITLGPYRRNDSWAWWSLLILFLTSLIPLVILTFRVAEGISSGRTPPWWLAAGMLVLAIAALGLRKKGQHEP